jgi:ATP-dependent Clp protease protease subunit
LKVKKYIHRIALIFILIIFCFVYLYYAAIKNVFLSVCKIWHDISKNNIKSSIMFDKNEFKKYAVKHLGLGSLQVENVGNQINKSAQAQIPNIGNFTPYVIEERQLNVASMDVFSRLMMDRIIFLGVGINDYVANVVQAQLLFLESVDPKRDIQIFVNSPGGSVIAGMGIYDTMQYVSPDVATICTGMAASMGAVLLCAGHKGKRTALPHSRVMIHQPLGGMQGQVTDMEISYNLIKTLQKELYNIMSTHTGQDYDTIFKDCERDNWMTSEEAKNYGLVDEVLVRKSPKA